MHPQLLARVLASLVSVALVWRRKRCLQQGRDAMQENDVSEGLHSSTPHVISLLVRNGLLKPPGYVSAYMRRDVDIKSQGCDLLQP
jgi:hypothetical protein